MGFLEGGDHAVRARFASACQIKSGAMVRRCTDKRQAKRDIDPLVKGQRFDWDQSLVMGGTQSNVIGFARLCMEQCIG